MLVNIDGMPNELIRTIDKQTISIQLLINGLLTLKLEFILLDIVYIFKG